MKNTLFKAALFAACTFGSSNGAMAADGESDGGFYVGVFGGVGSTSGQAVEQTGTAHKGFTEDDHYFTYDLGVDVTGTNQHKSGTTFGGQIGYEWKTSSAISPALEIEGSYLSAGQRSDLVNHDDDSVSNVKVTTGGAPTPVTDQDELHMVSEHVLNTPLSAGNHTFANSAKMRVALFTLNGVLTYKTGSKLKPYIGAGVGLAMVDMRNAVSLQTGPGGTETGRVAAGGDVVEINHFNSRDHANDLTFAVQVKGGVRYQVSKRVSLFAEYRLVHLATTAFTYGSTVYSTHAPTNNWVVQNGAMNLSNGLVGIRYGF